MLLLDTTGSMTWSNTGPETSTPPARKDVLGEAMGIIVEKLGALDSQAAAEEAAGEDKGGLMAVTFAAGTDYSVDEDDHPTNGKIGDLSVDNWRDKWGRIQWGNTTQIMPGWNALTEVFLDEFGETPALDRPKMLALVITDGEADDTDDFAKEMAKVGKSAYIVIALMGFGQEHDRAQTAYETVAAQNDHVRVVTFGNLTDPGQIADGVISMLGVA
jgi:hypothetical protein